MKPTTRPLSTRTAAKAKHVRNRIRRPRSSHARTRNAGAAARVPPKSWPKNGGVKATRTTASSPIAIRSPAGRTPGKQAGQQHRGRPEQREARVAVSRETDADRRRVAEDRIELQMVAREVVDHEDQHGQTQSCDQRVDGTSCSQHLTQRGEHERTENRECPEGAVPAVLRDVKRNDGEGREDKADDPECAELEGAAGPRHRPSSSKVARARMIDDHATNFVTGATRWSRSSPSSLEWTRNARRSAAVPCCSVTPSVCPPSTRAPGCRACPGSSGRCPRARRSRPGASSPIAGVPARYAASAILRR